MVCLICNQEVKKLLNFGLQPISKHYKRNKKDPEFGQPLQIGVCTDCGLVQIIKPFNTSTLKPKSYTPYNEPEDHIRKLSFLVKTLIKPNSQVCALGPKDISLAKEVIDSFEVLFPKIGAETIQEELPKLKHDLVDIIIARHVLEHAAKPDLFLKVLRSLIKPNGHLIIEVPDCTNAFKKGDYSTIWEEHTLYFTPITFMRSLERHGLLVEHLMIYPYPFENSIVVICSRKPGKNIESEIKLVTSFANDFEKTKKKIHDKLKAKAVVFGAGHLACSFINLFDLKKKISFVVDDDFNKWDHFMPGSSLLIKAGFNMKQAKTILLAVNPMNEDKIIKKYPQYASKMKSIFPSSERYLLKVR
jgi:hypothetical protein